MVVEQRGAAQASAQFPFLRVCCIVRQVSSKFKESVIFKDLTEFCQGATGVFSKGLNKEIMLRIYRSLISLGTTCWISGGAEDSEFVGPSVFSLVSVQPGH